MKKELRYKGRNKNGALGAIFGGMTIGILTLGLLISGAAAAGERGLFPMEALGVAGKLLYALALLCACLFAARRARKAPLLHAFAVGLGLFALALCASDAAGSSLASVIAPVLITPAGVLLGCLLAARRKRAGCL